MFIKSLFGYAIPLAYRPCFPWRHLETAPVQMISCTALPYRIIRNHCCWRMGEQERLCLFGSGYHNRLTIKQDNGEFQSIWESSLL